MHDSCDSALRKAAKIVTEHHINMPPAVSPSWVVESYKNNKLALPSQFPPNQLAAVSTTKQKAAISSKPSLSRSFAFARKPALLKVIGS